MNGPDSGKLTRREALRRMGVLGTGAALAPMASRLGLAAPNNDARKPNILFVVIDDLGYGDLGCYGSPVIESPQLDRLATQGVRLTQYYVAVPLCAPTRVSFMTGKYPQRTSLPDNPNWKDPNSGLSPDETTLAELLTDAGYHTGLVGKWHLGYSEKFRPLKQGFQEYYGFLSGWADYYEHTYRDGSKWMFKNEQRFDEPGYMTDLLTREAISYLDRHQDDPFFLYVAYNAPHWPHQAPDEWMKRSKSGAFGAMVACLDDSIGKVIGHLDELGLADETLVIFMSDNGGDGSGSNAPLSGGKGNLREGGIRVPFIARWPGKIPAGKDIDEPIVSMDLFATFAKVGGAELPEGVVVDGKDVLPVLAGKAKSPHKIMFWQHKNQSVARQGDLKLLRQDGEADRLYNVVADLGEKNDLAAERPDVVKELGAALDRWLAGLKKG
jgi:arylsulfatase A-like enzyme